MDRFPRALGPNSIRPWNQPITFSCSSSPTVSIAYVNNDPTNQRNVGDAYRVTVSFPNSFDLGLLPVPPTISQDAETRIESNETFKYEEC